MDVEREYQGHHRCRRDRYDGDDQRGRERGQYVGIAEELTIGIEACGFPQDVAALDSNDGEERPDDHRGIEHHEDGEQYKA